MTAGNVDAKKSRTRLALISTGLGNTARGFEVSTARWYDALLKYTDLDVRLFSGGDHPGATRVWNIPRQSLLLKPILQLPGMNEQHRWETTYCIEQISFFLALIPHVVQWRPDVIWVKDVPLAHILAYARWFPGPDYRLVFANGAAFKPKTYDLFDRIQQLHPGVFDQALQHGIAPDRMDLISNCISSDYNVPARGQTRKEFGLDDSDWVVVCVAAWNRYHKRIDYLINEVATVPDKRIKLVLCGVPESDQEYLQKLGREKLKDRILWLTVSQEKVQHLLAAADVFVLPSLNEGLGNVLIEAALAKLPIVCHPHDGAKFIIQDEYWMQDLSKPGNLAARIQYLLTNPPNHERLTALEQSVRSRFSDKTLSQRFEAMINATMRGLSTNNTQQVAVTGSESK